MRVASFLLTVFVFLLAAAGGALIVCAPRFPLGPLLFVFAGITEDVRRRLVKKHSTGR